MGSWLSRDVRDRRAVTDEALRTEVAANGAAPTEMDTSKGASLKD